VTGVTATAAEIEQPIAAQYFVLYAEPSDIGKNARGAGRSRKKCKVKLK